MHFNYTYRIINKILNCEERFNIITGFLLLKSVILRTKRIILRFFKYLSHFMNCSVYDLVKFIRVRITHVVCVMILRKCVHFIL